MQLIDSLGLGALRRMTLRQILFQVLAFLSIVASALMIWKGMSLVCNSESPIVVVLSGSMEPAFYRGDLLLLSLDSSPFKAGDICVYKLKGRDVPIVHRIMKVHVDSKTGEEFMLTKGDNNPIDDRGLYNPGQMWIKRNEIVGKAQAFVPYVGMVTIIMNDYPQLKVLLLAGLGIFVIFNRE